MLVGEDGEDRTLFLGATVQSITNIRHLRCLVYSCDFLVNRVGLAPTTVGLKDRCYTISASGTRNMLPDVKIGQRQLSRDAERFRDERMVIDNECSILMDIEIYSFSDPVKLFFVGR